MFDSASDQGHTEIIIRSWIALFFQSCEVKKIVRGSKESERERKSWAERERDITEILCSFQHLFYFFESNSAYHGLVISYLLISKKRKTHSERRFSFRGHPPLRHHCGYSFLCVVILLGIVIVAAQLRLIPILMA